MSKNDILLGIDFGTGGCKITAIDTSGTIRDDISIEYKTYFEHPGWSEQVPQSWYDAMCTGLKKLADRGLRLEDTVALAFDGSTHNAVLLDDAMHPIRRTIMWTDQRSVEECAYLEEHFGKEIFAVTYQSPSPTWTLPQLMWLKKHEPEMAEKTKHILFVKDYVRYCVTGVCATDYIEAQGTLFYDMRQNNWSEQLFALTGFSKEALPKRIKPTDFAGRVTAQAAFDTGIPEGTPVICGTSDSAAEDYGAGAIEPGNCIIKLATAGNVNIMTSKAVPHPKTLTYSHVVEGMYYSVSATNAAALCQRWFRDNFCKMEIVEAKKLGISAFELIGKEAAKSTLGANGVMFHPYLQGERSPYWDANLRASFTGISIKNDKSDFIRALLEGVVFSLLDCYGTLKEMNLDVNKIFLIGGGAKSKIWSQMVADVFERPVSISRPGDASFGTALIAGVGAKIFPDCKSAVRNSLKIDREVTPILENSKQYRKMFQQYRAVHDAMAKIYSKKF